MNPRWHAAILGMIAAVGVISMLWVKIAQAEETRSIGYSCDKEKKTCTTSIDDFIWLNQNFDAAMAEVKRLRAIPRQKCKYGDA